jgi:hypothetical protein
MTQNFNKWWLIDWRNERRVQPHQDVLYSQSYIYAECLTVWCNAHNKIIQ